MPEAALQGLIGVFEWSAFAMLLLGILIAFATGLLPGFGSVAAMALMLPFALELEPVQTFAFLLAMLAVTETTGDITSVLFGIPGESSTAATVLDGHPMAKRGEAGRALGAALMSSLVGALLGALFLAAAIPMARPLVLSLGQPEFFMLSIVGIALVASLSGRAVRRGLIAGGLGLALSMVGISAITGSARFTFGQLYLWDGISLVPVVIGLFAVPEIVELGVKGTSIAQRDVGKLGGVLEGVKDTFRHWGVTFRCSVLSSFLGMIPGIGTVAQWMTYAHAVQSASDKSQFGKGDVRGVVGPGAANNSKLGGMLVTALAFGIPGSVVTALLLGAFQIQGLAPGPDLVTKHLPLIYSMVWIIVIANVIGVGICFLFLNPLSRITHVRACLLIPFLTLMIFLGAFTTNNTYLDLVVMLIFGAVGWAMVTLGWPRPPLVLGLVLGRLAETYFFLSVGAYDWQWIFRPLVLVLIVMIVTAIAYPAFRSWRAPRVAVNRPAERPAIDPGWRRLEVGFTIVLLAFIGLLLWTSLGLNRRAGLFPWFVLYPTIVLVLWQLVDDLRGKTSPPATGEDEKDSSVETSEPLSDAETRRRSTRVVAWILGFFASILLLGFAIGGALASLLYLRLATRERLRTGLIYLAVVFLMLDVVFRQILSVPFPTGLAFTWLGVDPRLDLGIRL